MRNIILCIVSICLCLSLTACFLAQNTFDGGYQCSWWHLQKHPGYENFCKEQESKFRKRNWDDGSETEAKIP